MTATPEPAAQLTTATSIHLYGPVTADAQFVPGETRNYGYVQLARHQGTSDLTVFVQSAEQAQAIGNAFLHLVTQFILATPEQAHECGSAQDGPDGTNTYPVQITVSQRDLTDPESWVYRCAEQHASSVPGMTPSRGWQSADYPTEDDALISAKDHARAMHDMALPNGLREAADAAERAAAERMAPSGPAQ